VIDVLPRDAAGRVRFLPPKGFTSWPPVADWTEVHWSSWMRQRGYSAEEIANYLDYERFRFGVGFTATGAQATPQNAYDHHVRWLYKPTPKGVTLHATRDSGVPNILWGGAVGGAKSMTARWEAIAECLFSGSDHYRAIVIRRELEELRRTHMDAIDGEAVKLCEALGDPKAIKVTSQPPVATFLHTGAKILFGFAASPGDERRYMSEQYDVFLGDEASLLQWNQIVGIAGRLRNDPKLNRVPRMILTTNPGGPSHQACVDHFITKSISLDVNPLYRGEDYLYIRSQLYDNMHLMSRAGDFGDYEKRLYAYEPERRAQLLEGDWSAIVDQHFTAFDPALHVRAIA
jgi:hypothetical protein